MKGLIIKDLLGLKQITVTIAILMGFYLFMGFMSGGESNQVGYFSIMVLVINAMIPLTCAGYDEQCGWDTFGGALPVSRAKTVAARYMNSLLTLAGSLALVLIADLIYTQVGGYQTNASAYLYPFAAATLYVSLMNPIIYRFGVQKSRIVMIIIVLIPTFVGIALLALLNAGSHSEWLDAALDSVPENVFTQPDAGVVVCTVLVCAVIYALSMLLSFHIYQKKDL